MCSLSYSIRIASLKHMCVALVGFSYSNLCVEVSHNQDFRDRRTHHDRGTDTTTPADVRIIVVVRLVCSLLLWVEVTFAYVHVCMLSQTSKDRRSGHTGTIAVADATSALESTFRTIQALARNKGIAVLAAAYYVVHL